MFFMTAHRVNVFSGVGAPRVSGGFAGCSSRSNVVLNLIGVPGLLEETPCLRNVYTAAAPAFAPVRLTNVTKDDGVELSDISVSDDGAGVVFVRGTPPNREGWVANPTASPAGAAFNRLEEFIGRFLKGAPPHSAAGGR